METTDATRDRSDASGAAGEELRYWCFISYRHKDNQGQDRDWASWLHREIERYEVPASLVGTRNNRGYAIPERIYPVFRDEESLPADADLAERIQEALDASHCLLVLCSPRSVASRYVAEEIGYFQQAGRGHRILAAILDGEPGDPVRECFPEPLREGMAGERKSDLSSGPLAADFRLPGAREGYTSAEAYRLSLLREGTTSAQQIEELGDAYDQRIQLMKLKIIAGILGVPIEELRNRDRAYRLEIAKQRARVLRRWLGTVSLLLAAALLAGALALSLKFKADREAKRANHQQGEAEGLVSFLLGDLHDHLQPVGQIGALEELIERSSAYLEGNPEIKSYPNRVRLHLRRGQVLKELGRTAESIEDFRLALRYCEQVEPPLHSLLEAEVRVWFGDALTYVARLEEAAEQCEASLALLQGRDAPEPGESAEIALVRARAGIYFADVLVRGAAQGDRARELYASAVEELRSLKPDHLGRQAPLLLDALLKLGDARSRSADQGGALQNYRECLQHAEELSNAQGADIRYVRWRSEAQVRLAKLLLEIGEFDSADDELRRAREHLTRLIHHDPANVSWQVRNLVSLIEVARMEAERGRPREALATIEQVGTDLTGLSKLDAENVELRHLQVIALTLEGELCYSPRFPDTRDLARAKKILRSAVSHGRTILQGADAGEMVPYRRSLAVSELHLARVLRAQGEDSQAVETVERARDELLDGAGRGATRDSLLPELAVIFETLAGLHARNGEEKEARSAWLAAVEHRRQIASVQGESRGSLLDLATTLTQVGVFLLRSGEPEDLDNASEWLQESEQLGALLASSETEDRRALYLWAKASTELAILFRNRDEGRVKPPKDYRTQALKILNQLKDLDHRVEDCNKLLARLN